MVDICCMGELFVDMFAAETGKKFSEVTAFLPTPGGAAANVAVEAARLGKQAAFVGKVGDEAFGRWLAAVLAAEGVNVSGVRYDADARTTMNFITLPDANTPAFLFYRNPGADMMLRADELDADLICGSKIFHFGSLGLIDEPLRTATITAVKTAAEAGVLVSYDVNYRAPLWKNPQVARETILGMLPYVRILKVNEEEMRLLCGDNEDFDAGCRQLCRLGPDLIVVTLGPKGSYFYCANGSAFVDGFPVETADASGCGDAFIAGLLCQIASETDYHNFLNPTRLSKALQFANAAGAITAQTKGVIPALPTEQQVNHFLASFAVN